MIRSVIIDDEIHGQKLLYGLLNKYCPEVKIVAMADSMTKGIQVINEHKPDLVFLDIQMPNGNGFDLLDKLGKVEFDVIFTTAYDNYAIKAFKVSALDYLLKPIDSDDLVLAVKKMSEKKSSKSFMLDPRIDVLLELQRQKPEHKHVNNLSLPTQDGFEFVLVDEIVRLEAVGNYTNVYLKSGDMKIVTRTLKDFELILEHNPFIRCHHAHMVNLLCVTRYIKGEGGFLELFNKKQVEVSRRKKELVLQKLNIHY